MELENEIENNIEIEKKQNNFFDSMLGKIVNTGIDFGLRAILPDIIENQIIEIKNSFFKNGLSDGIKTASKSIVELSKSTKGIFTGKFENISQIQTAIGNGGIIDTVSNLLDKAINKTYEKGIINSNTNMLIKKGKNIILNNITNNLKNELKNQEKSLEKLNTNINRWNKYYENKDFEGMEIEYNKIEKQIDEIIPLENIIKNARKVEAMHNLIKNNGQNFNITEIEKELIQKLS